MILNINNLIEKINKKEPIKGLYLYGSFGIGKTHSMQELLNKTETIRIFGSDEEKQIYKERQGEIIVWPEHISKLKKNMDKDKTQEYQFDNKKMYNQKILIIDDIGGETPSDWELRDILFPLLNYRINNKMATFFTSNFSIQELERYYLKKCNKEAVGRVIDRIYGLTHEYHMNGKNWRREHIQQAF